LADLPSDLLRPLVATVGRALEPNPAARSSSVGVPAVRPSRRGDPNRWLAPCPMKAADQGLACHAYREAVVIWLWSAATATSGALLMLAAARRARAAVPLREAANGRAIADLERGRFRVVGRVVPIRTTPSGIDEQDCVYVERAEYVAVGGATVVPLQRLVDRRVYAHAFWLDDGTGRLLVNPVAVIVDVPVLEGDAGMLLERRLRVGEEVELVASFAPREHVVTTEYGPYRARAVEWEAVEDEHGPPRLTLTAEPSMLRPSDDTVAFMRGMGGLLLTMSAMFAAAGAL
jgi:hypothetical protein